MAVPIIKNKIGKEYSKLENWESEFYFAYNDAYKCYLHNQSPICFMNSFLEKIARTTGSFAGYIASSHEVDKKIYPNIESVYRDKSCDDFVLYNNWKLNVNDNSICMKSLTTGNIHIVDDITYIDKSCEPIKPPFYCKTYICIPYRFNDKIIGVLGLFGIDQNLINQVNFLKVEELLKVLGNLIGALQNSYFKIKLTTEESDKRLITYQLLEDILNTVHDGIVIVDNKFDIIHMNMYASKLIFEMEDDYKRNTGNDYKSNLENLSFAFPELNQLNDTESIKIFKNKKIDLTIDKKHFKRNLEFVMNTVICGGNFYHLVTIHCITKKENEMNGKKIIAYLSHELRNPLQSVTLANHLLKTGIKSFNDENPNAFSKKMTSYSDIINKSSQDMKKIINDILDLSRIDSNEFSVEMEIFDVSELVDNVIDDNIDIAIIKNLILEKEIDENVPSCIFTDPTRSRQILSNLVTNAIKYSNSGKILLRVMCDSTHLLKFIIKDQGTGIKESEICNLFKHYGQTSNSKSNLNSQGLGLCVSQKIANLLGGKITVKSDHTKGSTFTFYHPISLELSGNKYENNQSIGELTGSVLLVDDNFLNLSLLRALLEQFNYEYTWSIKLESVNSGEQAVELCKINKYHIVFMDINMPGINGCTASKIIKNNGYVGKIIATTGNILSKDENKKLDSDENYNYFDEIIVKPFDDQVMIKVLRTFLEN